MKLNFIHCLDKKQRTFIRFFLRKYAYVSNKRKVETQKPEREFLPVTWQFAIVGEIMFQTIASLVWLGFDALETT
jgi:hypothetical protein